MPRISASTKNAIQPLLKEKDRLESQMARLWEQAEALRNKVAGIEVAIALLQGGPPKAPELPIGDVSATNVKDLILTLAKDAGATGLNANSAVKMAANRNIKLLRGTAASNLSRLKALGLLVHDGKVYRLPEFVRQTVHHLTAVGITGGKSS